ncbi:MAG: hypothetical protein MUF46_02805 [Desulfobacterales bacterium]|jgi:hypothetical protein|nr:hypothetical protein [Desulfobacterales bacterium]
MDDPKKRSLNQPPPEDEEIIELIDEVPDVESGTDLSEIEQNLLELERRFAAEPAPTPDQDNALEAELPDLGDLEELDFELEPDAPEPKAASPATQPPAAAGMNDLEKHLDWLFDEELPPPAPQAAESGALDPNEVIPIAEFDEQFLEPEVPPLGETAAAAADAGSEEDETLELLDIEEDAPEDELIVFDAPETAPEAEEEPLELFTEETPDAPESAPAEPIAAADAALPVEPVEIPPAAVAAAVVAAAAAPEKTTLPPAPAAAPETMPPLLEPLSPQQIEAAVEKVVTRLYSSRIEAIILQAIQKAVTLEIERLKNELLDHETGG